MGLQIRCLYLIKQPSPSMPFSIFKPISDLDQDLYQDDMLILWKNREEPKTWENVVLQRGIQKLQCRSLHRYKSSTEHTSAVLQKSTSHTLPVSKTIRHSKTEKHRMMKKRHWQKTPRLVSIVNWSHLILHKYQYTSYLSSNTFQVDVLPLSGINVTVPLI